VVTAQPLNRTWWWELTVIRLYFEIVLRNVYAYWCAKFHLMLAGVMIGHVPFASRQPGQISLYRTGLVNLLEGTRPNFLYITKKYFRVPMKILSTKIRPWSLPLLLLLLLLRYVIINAWYNYYISNKFLLEVCDKKEHVELTGAATASWKRRW